ncbi:hypothetical protein [Paraglaciecola sp. L1A13]|uniref:hypothetical protein n=1 Tax=Paraglaciecola sp. L1A13 TaxID=2686359 RepID=UPI00131E6CA2|nr:hypothetical protein [Paraglaciecola sp. L1A13]
MITFLIVEDCHNKLSAIKQKLNGLGVSEFRIKETNNKNDALNFLKESIFDFLILDINIYASADCVSITKNAGVDLLIAIEDSIFSPRKKYNIPNTIFVMSEYPDAITNNGESFNKCKVIPCQYSSDSEDWMLELDREVKLAELKQQSVIDRKSNDIVVYSVHGIQTFGGWQGKLDRELKSHTETKVLEHIPYKYHHFPIIHFLRTGKRLNEVNKFSKEIKLLANRSPDTRICLVGHSFGTYIIAESLKSLDVRINVESIVLSGSVLRSDYDWSEIISRHNIKTIINDCASNDLALVASHFFARGLGKAGIEGFSPHGGIVQNRYFNGGHSQFCNNKTLKEWCCLIHGEEINIVDERKDAGLYDSFISWFTKTSRRWIYTIFFLIFMSILCFFII